MKYITFYREGNKFGDILTDPVIQKLIRFKITWTQFLIIGIEDYASKNEQAISYITLKYGDDMKSETVPDRSPIPYVDYVPEH